MAEAVATRSTTTEPKGKKEFKCTICDLTFLKGPGLGSHMRIVHGIAGTSASTIAARRLKESSTAAAPAVSATVPKTNNQPKASNKPSARNAKLKCPECGKHFSTTAVLGNHRRFAHNVKSKTRRQQEERAKRKAEKLSQIVLSNAERIPSPNGKKLNGNGSSITASPSIPTNNEHQANAPSLDPIAYAIAVGSVKEFCRHFAEEHGLVTREFTRQFAELFLREARR